MILTTLNPNTLSTPYILAIGSNLCFGTASIVFSRFAIRYSANWVNQLKVSISLILFLLAFSAFESFTRLPIQGHAYLMLSGAIGLFLGDYFLFGSLAKLGPTRTLVLYTFEPLLVGLYGYLFLQQSLSSTQFLAIAFMIACVLTFIFERKDKTGALDLGTFAFAFLGVLFDAIGIMFSRQAYELNPNLGSFQVNSTRALGAFIGFLFLKPQFLMDLARDLKSMNRVDRSWVVSACIIGTFISLTLYLTALKSAHVATLTAISITSPLWVSMIEHIQKKEWPDRYLWTAFALFLTGFCLMQIHP